MANTVVKAPVITGLETLFTPFTAASRIDMPDSKWL